MTGGVSYNMLALTRRAIQGGSWVKYLRDNGFCHERCSSTVLIIAEHAWQPAESQVGGKAPGWQAM